MKLKLKCHPIVLPILAKLLNSARAGFSEEGAGVCLSSGGLAYDYAMKFNSGTDATAAIAWCLSAEDYKSSLVGLEISYGHWLCRYDNGIIDNLSLDAFSPPAHTKFTGLSGTGSVDKVTGQAGAVCWKNNVRPYIHNYLHDSFSHLSRHPQILWFDK